LPENLWRRNGGVGCRSFEVSRLRPR
jgi:hypothetical protein